MLKVCVESSKKIEDSFPGKEKMLGFLGGSHKKQLKFKSLNSPVTRLHFCLKRVERHWAVALNSHDEWSMFDSFLWRPFSWYLIKIAHFNGMYVYFFETVKNQSCKTITCKIPMNSWRNIWMTFVNC